MSDDPFADPAAMAPAYSALGEAPQRRRDIPGWGVALIVIGGVMIGGFFAALGAAVAIPVALSYEEAVDDGGDNVAAPASATPDPVSSSAPEATAPPSPEPQATGSAAASPSPEASSDTPGSLTLHEKVVFGDEQWQLTPLPSWRAETRSKRVKEFESSVQEAVGALDAELIGVWHPGGVASDSVYAIHYTYGTPLTDTEFDEAFLIAHADSYVAAGATVMASEIEWTRVGQGPAAILEISIDMDGSLTYQTLMLVQLDDSIAVVTGESPQQSKARAGAWGAANSLRFNSIDW